MKQNAWIVIACFALSMKLAAQENPATAITSKQIGNNMFTGISPAVGQTCVFGSIKEKEMSVTGKRNNVIEQIKKKTIRS
jgi:hypothetical protein